MVTYLLTSSTETSLVSPEAASSLSLLESVSSDSLESADPESSLSVVSCASAAGFLSSFWSVDVPHAVIASAAHSARTMRYAFFFITYSLHQVLSVRL